MWQLQASHGISAMLQETLDQLQSNAAAEGAFGSSTARYITGARDDSLLPAGAMWRPVRVKYPRCGFSVTGAASHCSAKLRAPSVAGAICDWSG